MTRATHLLVHGDFSGALYFNWLAFPFCGAAAFLVLLFILEIVGRRQIFDLRVIAPLTARRLTICALAAIGLWVVNSYLAVSQHKNELLNPNGLLYSLLIRNR